MICSEALLTMSQPLFLIIFMRVTCMKVILVILVLLFNGNTPLTGKKRIAKVAVEAVDEEKKIVIYKVIEGSDMLTDYKSVTVTIHVLSKGDYDTVIWSMKFEKFEDIGPYPTDLMDFAITVTRGIEAHHVNTLA